MDLVHTCIQLQTYLANKGDSTGSELATKILAHVQEQEARLMQLNSALHQVIEQNK